MAAISSATLQLAPLQTRLLWATQQPQPLSRSDLHYRPGITVWNLERGLVEISSGEDMLTFIGPCWLLLGSGWSRHLFEGKIILRSVSVRMQSADGPIFALPPVTQLDLSDLDPEARALISLFSRRFDQRTELQNALHQLKLHAAVAAWTLHLGQILQRRMPDAFAPTLRHAGLRSAIALLDEHPHDATEPDLARAAGLSVSHFKRVFQRESGISLREFRRQRQVDDVIESLLHTDKPIKQIALDLGYSDTANFDRWFRQHFNRSPSSYRARQTSKPPR